jgi:hypothetical protein
MSKNPDISTRDVLSARAYNLSLLPKHRKPSSNSGALIDTPLMMCSYLLLLLPVQLSFSPSGLNTGT